MHPGSLLFALHSPVRGGLASEALCHLAASLRGNWVGLTSSGAIEGAASLRGSLAVWHPGVILLYLADPARHYPALSGNKLLLDYPWWR